MVRIVVQRLQVGDSELLPRFSQFDAFLRQNLFNGLLVDVLWKEKF